MLGLGLAVLAVGGITGVAYLLSQFKYPAPPPAGAGAGAGTVGPDQMQPGDQLKAEPPPAASTNVQEGIADVKDSNLAQAEANEELPPDTGGNPFTDREDGKFASDVISENTIKGVGSFCEVGSGESVDRNPEFAKDSGDYEGPPVY